MFTTPAKKYLVQTTVLPLFDYGDVIYRNASKGVLEQLDVLYHADITFLLLTNTFELDIIAYKLGNSLV